MNALTTAFPADHVLVHGLVTGISLTETAAGTPMLRVTVANPASDRSKSLVAWDGTFTLSDDARSVTIGGTTASVGDAVRVFVGLKGSGKTNPKTDRKYTEWSLGAILGFETL